MWVVKTLSHYMAVSLPWNGVVKLSRAPCDSKTNDDGDVTSFSWRSRFIPTATEALPRSSRFIALSRRSHGVRTIVERRCESRTIASNAVTSQWQRGKISITAPCHRCKNTAKYTTLRISAV